MIYTDIAMMYRPISMTDYESRFTSRESTSLPAMSPVAARWASITCVCLEEGLIDWMPEQMVIRLVRLFEGLDCSGDGAGFSVMFSDRVGADGTPVAIEHRGDRVLLCTPVIRREEVVRLLGDGMHVSAIEGVVLTHGQDVRHYLTVDRMVDDYFLVKQRTIRPGDWDTGDPDAMRHWLCEDLSGADRCLRNAVRLPDWM